MTMAENDGRVLTCVYCGQEYPQDTPAWGAQVLTDHIKVCPMHPMRQAEADIATLRKTLQQSVAERDAAQAEVRRLREENEKDVELLAGLRKELEAIEPFRAFTPATVREWIDTNGTADDAYSELRQWLDDQARGATGESDGTGGVA
jgi:hypothetical protein